MSYLTTKLDMEASKLSRESSARAREEARVRELEAHLGELCRAVFLANSDGPVEILEREHARLAFCARQTPPGHALQVTEACSAAISLGLHIHLLSAAAGRPISRAIPSATSSPDRSASMPDGTVGSPISRTAPSATSSPDRSAAGRPITRAPPSSPSSPDRAHPGVPGAGTPGGGRAHPGAHPGGGKPPSSRPPVYRGGPPQDHAAPPAWHAEGQRAQRPAQRSPDRPAAEAPRRGGTMLEEARIAARAPSSSPPLTTANHPGPASQGPSPSPGLAESSQLSRLAGGVRGAATTPPRSGRGSLKP
eukprot:CAMPEP_0180115904 /NCGR_PEP_ID=MMETSP0986-20121125/54_1 /TAXON_ID=697907 /ORGANISM="non described non described, Strain CCMP2293" /LENGTH=305 /DNA_ID=CAMNT_0022054583 /DNA_START=24 /DNA_END=938 /DNA_ORIENTATION=-